METLYFKDIINTKEGYVIDNLGCFYTAKVDYQENGIYHRFIFDYNQSIVKAIDLEDNQLNLDYIYDPKTEKYYCTSKRAVDRVCSLIEQKLHDIHMNLNSILVNFVLK